MDELAVQGGSERDAPFGNVPGVLTHVAEYGPDDSEVSRNRWRPWERGGTRRSMTNASLGSTAPGGPSSRKWPTSSSPVGSWNTASPASAVTPARTNTCSRSRASAGMSARAATPSASPSGRSGWTPRSSRRCRTDQVVLTIPKRPRAYCLYRHRLLGDIARVAARQDRNFNRARSSIRQTYGAIADHAGADRTPRWDGRARRTSPHVGGASG